MTNWTTEHTAKIGIGIQLLILIRLPAEVFRLKYLHGANLTVAAVEPFIRGELITAICRAGLLRSISGTNIRERYGRQR